MEKAKTRKIKKWDEVHGEHEVEVSIMPEDVSRKRWLEPALPSAEIR